MDRDTSFFSALLGNQLDKDLVQRFTLSCNSSQCDLSGGHVDLLPRIPVAKAEDSFPKNALLSGGESRVVRAFFVRKVFWLTSGCTLFCLANQHKTKVSKCLISGDCRLLLMVELPEALGCEVGWLRGW